MCRSRAAAENEPVTTTRRNTSIACSRSTLILRWNGLYRPVAAGRASRDDRASRSRLARRRRREGAMRMSLLTESTIGGARYAARAASGGYFGRYCDLRLSRAADGILVARFNTRCGPLAFAPHDYAEFEDAFRHIGRDARNQVVVLAGAGGDFVAGFADDAAGSEADIG